MRVRLALAVAIAAGLGDRDAVIRCLRQSCRLGTLEFLSYNNLSWALSTARNATAADLDEALWLARRGLEIAPFDTCWDTLAEALWKRGNLPEAAVALRAASRLSPDKPVYRDRLMALCKEMNLSPFRSLLDRPARPTVDDPLQTLVVDESNPGFVDHPADADQTLMADDLELPPKEA